jgi:hypothetical protein
MAKLIQASVIVHEHKTKGAKELLEVNKRIEVSFEAARQSVAKTAGGFAIAANQALELASKVASLAGEVADLAKAGAVARDVAKRFRELGAAVPAMQALQAAVAGTVDETTLQQFALLAEEMGLTAEESTGLAQRITVLATEQGRLSEVNDILKQSLESPKEALKKLGVVVDESNPKFAGLAEQQKNLAIIQDESAKATQDQVDALDSAQINILRVEARLENMVSDLQVAVSEWLEGSGALDMVSAALERASQFVSDHASLFETAGGIVQKVGSIIGRILVPALERMAEWLEIGFLVLDPFLDGVSLLLDGLEALGEFIPSLNDLASDFFITDMPVFESNVKSLREEVDIWADTTRKAVEAARQQAVVARDIELSRKNRVNEQAARVVGIKLANDELEQINQIIGANSDLDTAMERLVQRYGDEEGAVDALNQRINAVTRGRADAIALFNKAQAAGQTALASQFQQQLETFDQARTGMQALTAELTKQATERDEITTAVEKETTATKASNEANRERFFLFKAWADAEQAVFAPVRQHRIEQARELATILDEAANREMEGALAQADDTAAIAAQNLTEQNIALSESLNLVGDSLASVVSQSGSDFERFFAGSMRISKGLGAIVKGVDAAGDSTAGAVSAVAGASAAIAGDVFNSTTAQAALLAVDETAKGFRDLAIPSPVTAGLHFTAAGIFGTVAAMSFLGSGGRSASGGGGGGGAAGAPSGPTFAPSMAETSDADDTRPPGTTVIVNYQSPNSREGFEFLTDVLNEGNREGSGARLDADLIEGLG